MVVGTTPYQDRREAYPLDRKTLRRTALRSFFMHGSKNSETGTSIGWTWAIAPALAKIHTDEQDLSTSLGQNLEYNETSHLFCTLVMGVSLAMEAQKCDPAEIRSVRTSLGLALHSLEKTAVFGFVFPWLLTVLNAMISGNNYLAPVIYGAVLLVLTVILRFVLINVGYRQGARIFEKIARDEDRLKKTCTIWGVFTIGALIGASGVHYWFTGNSTLSTNSLLSGNASPAFAVLGLGVTLLLYHLLTRKNWTLGRCVWLLVLIALVFGFLSLL
ncbi:MAG: PTS system mannose/fructose/sorbose family transporter subunit IID [Solobacterium sp.]|jgi:PTS system N-acetylgalactosamine-specific IID component|nr:PTS system mannose/fructose/sorbose family transporter subunit IID [Solobacterium sp.]MCH4047857.1 PTS system mannose/fructose/sorbose family transporter subunit IID [Solobacterium sp.]MCH4075557.1 PTS system mannose/fructose/sorbose family transporter subunit IID [Solobacterium sp.]MCI1313247.1 PTS system mannose/fructose/sorbose family transporter subunit IID [Solobacterium sp.]MCI1346017.1 PTS system mannose/fructose/sorbose family transporter subunit IID [Solobacterium sp.]